jgi:hypothetical protein
LFFVLPIVILILIADKSAFFLCRQLSIEIDGVVLKLPGSVSDFDSS